LEAEQTRRGHTDQHVADELGITLQKYQGHKEQGTFRVSEILALVKMYDKPAEHLLWRRCENGAESEVYDFCTCIIDKIEHFFQERESNL